MELSSWLASRLGFEAQEWTLGSKGLWLGLKVENLGPYLESGLNGLDLGFMGWIGSQKLKLEPNGHDFGLKAGIQILVGFELD